MTSKLTFPRFCYYFPIWVIPCGFIQSVVPSLRENHPHLNCSLPLPDIINFNVLDSTVMSYLVNIYMYSLNSLVLTLHYNILPPIFQNLLITARDHPYVKGNRGTGWRRRVKKRSDKSISLDNASITVAILHGTLFLLLIKHIQCPRFVRAQRKIPLIK